MITPSARILIVDDHPLMRQALEMLLATDGSLGVVATCGTAREALALAELDHVELVIVDIMMPEMSGIRFAVELAQRYPTCKVLGMSASEDPIIVADLLRVSASGFVCKMDSAAEICNAVHAVLHGERYLSPRVSKELVDASLACEARDPLLALTSREREIFDLIVFGRSTGEIAQLLSISVRTVETHRLRITNKLSVRKLLELQRVHARSGAN